MASVLRVDSLETSNGVPVLSSNGIDVVLSGNVKVESGALKVPVWTEATRPVSPEVGMIGYNSDITSLEIYADVANGTPEWTPVGSGATVGLPNDLEPWIWYKSETLDSISDGSNVTSYANSGFGGATYNLETGNNGTPPLKSTISGYSSLYWPEQSARHLRFVGGTTINLINGGSFGNQGFTCFWVSRCLAEYGSQYGSGGAFPAFCGYPGGGTHSSFGHIYTAGSNSADQRWGTIWENDGFIPYAGASGNRNPNPLTSSGGFPVKENIPSTGFFGAASATQWAYRHMGNSDTVPGLVSGWKDKSQEAFFQSTYSSYTGTSNCTIRGIGAGRSNLWLGGWRLETLLYNKALTDAEVNTVRAFLGSKFKDFGSANN